MIFPGCWFFTLLSNHWITMIKTKWCHLRLRPTWPETLSGLGRVRSPQQRGSSAPAKWLWLRLWLVPFFKVFFFRQPSLIISTCFVLQKLFKITIVVIKTNISTFFGPLALVLVVPKLNLGFGAAGVDWLLLILLEVKLLQLSHLLTNIKF